jgi:hypothetical protein
MKERLRSYFGEFSVDAKNSSAVELSEAVRRQRTDGSEEEP